MEGYSFCFCCYYKDTVGGGGGGGGEPIWSCAKINSQNSGCVTVKAFAICIFLLIRLTLHAYRMKDRKEKDHGNLLIYVGTHLYIVHYTKRQSDGYSSFLRALMLLLEGSNPSLKNQFIGVRSHFRELAKPTHFLFTGSVEEDTL